MLTPYRNNLFSGGGGGSFTKTFCSYYFNGTSGLINLSNAFSPNIEGTNKVFSMRFVIKRMADLGNDWFFSNWNGGTSNRSMVIRFNSSDNKIDILFSSAGTATSGNWKSTAAITANTWLDLVIVYNQGVVTVYKDGVIFAGVSTTIPTTIHPAVSTDAELGGNSYSGGGIFSNTYINQFALTTDVITSQEATDLNNSGSPRITSDVVGVENEYIFKNDTWNGSVWSVLDSTTNIDAVSVGMIAADRDCNENPY